MVFIIAGTPRRMVGVSLRGHENDGDMRLFRIDFESVKIIIHHRLHAPAHHVHAENHPAGLVPVVVFGNVDDVCTLKTVTPHRVGPALEIPESFTVTGASDWSVLQFMCGING